MPKKKKKTHDENEENLEETPQIAKKKKKTFLRGKFPINVDTLGQISGNRSCNNKYLHQITNSMGYSHHIV